MKRATAAGAAALGVLAALEAVPFRRAALARLDLPSLGWDASCHALDGLTLYDDLRRLHLLSALGDVFGQHWWPPLWSLALAPFYFLFGARLETASLPSFVAFVLTPVAAWLFCRRLLKEEDAAASWIAFALLAVFFLRSPFLLEMSSWAMLESLGGLLGVVAWLFFAGRRDIRERRAAYVCATALFFLKYYYGIFLIVPFAFEAWAAADPEKKAQTSGLLRRLIPAHVALTTGLLAGLLAAARRMAESRLAAALPFLPSVSNILWGLLVIAVLFLAIRRAGTRELWRELSPELRAFVACTIVPIGLWFLDPANVRGWWRQSFVSLEGVHRSFAEQFAALLSFVVSDYTLGLPVSLVVLLGFGVSLASKERTLVLLGLSAVLTVAGLSLRAYPVEARFLGSVVPGVFAAASAGIALAVARFSRPVRTATGILLVAGASAFVAMSGAAWRDSRAARTSFRLIHGSEERALVARLIETPPTDGRIGLTLTDDPKIAATVHLGLRLRYRDLPPEAVVVDEVPAR